MRGREPCRSRLGASLFELMEPLQNLAMLAGLLLVSLGVLGFLLWRLKGRLPRRWRRKTLRYPVVLVHGVLGFDELSLGKAKQQYFRGLPAHLEKVGADVFVAKIPPTSSVAARGQALANIINGIDAKRVNIIAHSMGGLDSRYAIAKLGVARRVASLTTVGSPHRGTPLADIGTGMLGDGLGLRQMLSRLSVPMDAFYDLTTVRLGEFNQAIQNQRGVHYASVVGALGTKRVGLNPLLLPSYVYLRRSFGDNDGMVPAASQDWGEVLFRIEADHWAQIGWSRQFDALGFYAELLEELAGRGL